MVQPDSCMTQGVSCPARSATVAYLRPILLIAVLVSLELHAAETTLRLSLPLDYQVYQRATRAAGTIVVAGSFAAGIEYPVTLEAKLIGALPAVGWQKLADLNSGATGFSAEMSAPAGGWYRLEVRAKHDNVTVAQT